MVGLPCAAFKLGELPPACTASMAVGSAGEAHARGWDAGVLECGAVTSLPPSMLHAAWYTKSCQVQQRERRGNCSRTNNIVLQQQQQQQQNQRRQKLQQQRQQLQPQQGAPAVASAPSTRMRLEILTLGLGGSSRPCRICGPGRGHRAGHRGISTEQQQETRKPALKSRLHLWKLS